MLLALLLACPTCASAGWTFKDARHEPASPDHEHNTTFHATVSFENETPAENGSAGNGTGTNGTGTNGTGGNQTVDVTGCRLVIESQDNRTTEPVARLEMRREGPGNDFLLTLGPWPPGTEVLYHYEANLSNGTVLRSNSSWVRTPELLAVNWHYSLDEAMRLARELGRPLMVLVYSGYAQTNRALDENLSRPGILALSPGFVCCRVDNESFPAFSLERGLGRLPVLVFENATTGRQLARLDNPFDGALVEREMRHILGKGPKPVAAAEDGPDYRLPAAALGAALVIGPVALYVLLRRAKRREKG